MMIQYKGTYFQARQYMPKKPQKWRIKVWSLADAKSKYVYNFNIYCGRNIMGNGDGNIGGQPSRQGKPKLVEDVVLKLIHSNEGRRHCIVMDNYFSSIGLFEELGKIGTYATGTIRGNRVGLPMEFMDTKEFNKKDQGSLVWKMHSSRRMSWKDKKVVVLLSSHAIPMDPPNVPRTVLP